MRIKRLKVFILLFFLFSLKGFTKEEIKFPFSAIPIELVKNADMVVRLYEMNYEVRSLTQATLTVHLVMTALRENALDDCSLDLYYDNYSKITELNAVFYNAEGIITRRSRSSDINDKSAIPDGSFYTDDRVKTIKFLSNVFPCTVEYFFEIRFQKLLSYSKWQPQHDYNVSVEKAILHFSAPDEIMPRFREVNIQGPPVFTKNKGITTVIYSLNGLPVIETEPFCPPLETRVSTVYIAPNDYKALNFPGDFRSWKSFGLWYYSMIKDRDKLPDKTKQQIIDLTKDIQVETDKIKAIYRYMQQNTRYVSVQLGIGGWQPVDAMTVAEKGYGDCKGLVNYTKALMNCAGIHSIYTLVKSGKDASDISLDFPSQQFDHVILCVPLSKDTIWLECTSQTQPFGFLGTFTCNRHVLLITEEGGIITRTPVYPIELNNRYRKININLDSNGNADIDVVARYRGLKYEDAESMEFKSLRDWETALLKKIKITSATILKINYRFNKEIIPEAEETIQFHIRSLASVSGNRLFVPMNLFENTVPNKMLTQRKTSVNIKYSYTTVDSIEVLIPPGYKVENIPNGEQLKTLCAVYRSETEKKESGIYWIKKLEFNEGIYPPESYTDLYKFFQNIIRSEKSNAVLIHN